jgi:uncharacterized iron-regulated membrane protein
MGQFITNAISIISGLLAIVAALGLTISNDLAKMLSLTGVPLSVLFGVSLIIALFSGGAAYLQRNNVTKKQTQIGGKNNSQNMS